MITMYDSTDAQSIPADARAVAGYVDGSYRNFTELTARFYPHAHCLSIGGLIGNLAEVSDIERDNPINTPALVRADFERKRKHGVYRPCYYADMEDMLHIVLPGLVGVPRKEYRLWLADWNGKASVPDGFDAHQYQGSMTVAYDASVCRADFFPVGSFPTSPKPSRKVTAGALSGAIVTAVLAVLNAHGVHLTHLTAPEMTAIGVAASAIAAYVRRG